MDSSATATQFKKDSGSMASTQSCALSIADQSSTLSAADRATFEVQKEFLAKNGPPSAAVQIDRVKQTKALLIDNRDRITPVLSEDFSCRSKYMTSFADVCAPEKWLNSTLSHRKRWTRADYNSSPAPFRFMGAKSSIAYELKGVIGSMPPWNVSFQISFTKELHGVNDDTKMSSDFAALPFDHTLFTGNTGTEAQQVIDRASSSGVSVSEVGMNATNPNLPFGGVDASDLGAYHGNDSFKTFSHAKLVYHQTRFPLDKMMMPPRKPKFRSLLEKQLQ